MKWRRFNEWVWGHDVPAFLMLNLMFWIGFLTGWWAR